MKAKAIREPSTLVRFDDLDGIPPAEPLSSLFREMSDDEFTRRATADPDAGESPPGFWNDATGVDPQTDGQITLRLDLDVLRYFRQTGDGYRSRMNAVLKSYVDAQRGQS